MNKTEELKLKFVRKWCSLLNEAEVVQDLEEYAQQVSKERAIEIERCPYCGYVVSECVCHVWFEEY